MISASEEVETGTAELIGVAALPSLFCSLRSVP